MYRATPNGGTCKKHTMPASATKHKFKRRLLLLNSHREINNNAIDRPRIKATTRMDREELGTKLAMDETSNFDLINSMPIPDLSIGIIPNMINSKQIKTKEGTYTHMSEFSQETWLERSFLFLFRKQSFKPKLGGRHFRYRPDG